MLTLRVFLSMLRDYICLFCFVLFCFFVDPSAGSARPPLPVFCLASHYIGSRNVSVVPLQFFCLASHYIGSRNVHTEKQPLIFAVIRLSVN